jgi:hypothetical protein
MITCPTCHNINADSSRFCDECGTRLAQPPVTENEAPSYVPPPPPVEQHRVSSSNATSFGVPPVEFAGPARPVEPLEAGSKGVHATLLIERGGSPGTEFSLTNDETTIGRWDADNGVFPDIDLDAHDEDAKVSRRHARIRRNNGSYFIEDLGSTNGTYVNRGRRLLPGNAQLLSDGDEVIVGKTFLRFRINH